MTAPVVRVGIPLWIVRGSHPVRMNSGVLLRAVARSDGEAGSQAAVVLGWQGPEPAPLSSDSLVHAVVKEVRASHAPQKRHAELALKADILLVTVMKVGSTPATTLLEVLDHATDDFLPIFSAVQGVAFAVSPDGRWVVEVLRASGAQEMKEIQQNPQMGAHIAHMGELTASMEPQLYTVEEATDG